MECELLCCRICLENNFSGQSIFQNYKEEFLPDIIKDITGISVLESDELPSKVCFSCADLLLKAHNIRKRSLESDAFLRSQLMSSNKNWKTNKSTRLIKDIDLQDGVVWTQINVVNNQNIEIFGPVIEDSNDLELALNKYLESSDVLQNKCQQKEEVESRPIENNIDDESTKIEKIEKDNDMDTQGNYEDLSDVDDLKEMSDCEQVSLRCNYCSKKFANKIAYKRHQNYHAQEKTKCPICPRQFSHKSNLKRHLSVHKDKNELFCDKCGENFLETKDLYEHLKSHIKSTDADRDEYILVCEFCTDKTTSLAFHLTHMKETHNIDVTKPFKCRLCDIKFASKQGMYRHIDNIHENNRRNLRNRDKNFLCNTCGKKFYTNFHLEVHIRSHTGERPFKCRYCEKSFSQLSGLKMHTFIHTGEKPFACKVCGKKFNQYGHVREHQLTHSGERPHVCEICKHSFRVKGNLTAHMMIHTGRKPYSCSYCERGFTQRAKLQSHVEKSHGTANVV